MLKRAYKLQHSINRFISSWRKNDLSTLRMSPAEWRQVAYLRELLREFAVYTVILSEHTGTTIHRVYDIYDSLFNHIEDYLPKLQSKQFGWKKRLYRGLKAAQEKLQKYYAETSRFHGDIYAIAAILNPCNKLETFKGASWTSDRGHNYAGRYQKKLRDIYHYYQKQFPSLVQNTTPKEPTGLLEQAIHASKRRRMSPGTTPSNEATELQSYLGESKYKNPG